MSEQTEANRAAALEAELISACQLQAAGWESDIVLWLRSNNDWLKRRCTARLGCLADAEDAMQDITLKVLHSITKFEGRSSLRTWVICIADNHCSSLMKKRASKMMTAHMQHLVAHAENERFDDHANGSTDLQASVQNTLSTLSEKNSEILRLRFFSDYSLSEITRILGLSLSATKMRLYRAMDAFEQMHGVNKL